MTELIKEVGDHREFFIEGMRNILRFFEFRVSSWDDDGFQCTMFTLIYEKKDHSFVIRFSKTYGFNQEWSWFCRVSNAIEKEKLFEKILYWAENQLVMPKEDLRTTEFIDALHVAVSSGE